MHLYILYYFYLFANRISKSDSRYSNYYSKVPGLYTGWFWIRVQEINRELHFVEYNQEEEGVEEKTYLI